MSKRFATAVLAALLPVSAMAQVAEPASPLSYPLVDQLLVRPDGGMSAGLSSEPAIPVWASPDGRLLALVSLSHADGAPILPRAPLMGSGADWRIIDATNLVSGGLRWQWGGGVSAQASFAQLRPASHCGAAGSLCSDFSGIATQQRLTNLGIGWTAVDQATSLSYGMSWLRGGATAPVAFNASPMAWPGLVPLASPYRIDAGNTLFARGQFVLDSGTRIELGASRGTTQLLPFSLVTDPVGGALSLDQSSLSFGVSQGSLRGSIVGHVIDSAGGMLPGRRWTLLDIGLSWRTPWQGELSFGTQSYLAPQVESPKRDAEIAPSRVPYVQYRQDL